MEKANVTGTGCIETIFERDIVDKRLDIIRSLRSGRHLTTQYDLETVIEETLRITETVVGTFSSRISRIVVFYSHREAGILQVSGQCIDLAGKYTVQCRSHIQSPTSGTSRISQIEPGSQHCNGLFTPFISTHRSQLILHFRIIGRIDLKGQ